MPWWTKKQWLGPWLPAPVRLRRESFALGEWWIGGCNPAPPSGPFAPRSLISDGAISCGPMGVKSYAGYEEGKPSSRLCVKAWNPGDLDRFSEDDRLLKSLFGGNHLILLQEWKVSPKVYSLVQELGFAISANEKSGAAVMIGGSGPKVYRNLWSDADSVIPLIGGSKPAWQLHACEVGWLRVPPPPAEVDGSRFANSTGGSDMGAAFQAIAPSCDQPIRRPFGDGDLITRCGRMMWRVVSVHYHNDAGTRGLDSLASNLMTVFSVIVRDKINIVGGDWNQAYRILPELLAHLDGARAFLVNGFSPEMSIVVLDFEDGFRLKKMRDVEDPDWGIKASDTSSHYPVMVHIHKGAVTSHVRKNKTKKQKRARRRAKRVESSVIVPKPVGAIHDVDRAVEPPTSMPRLRSPGRRGPRIPELAAAGASSPLPPSSASGLRKTLPGFVCGGMLVDGGTSSMCGARSKWGGSQVPPASRAASSTSTPPPLKSRATQMGAAGSASSSGAASSTEEVSDDMSSSSRSGPSRRRSVGTAPTEDRRRRA